jgi:hypothetical protein
VSISPITARGRSGATGSTGPSAMPIRNTSYVVTSTSRFRSFSERYVIERASQFRAGFELEDAHAAVQDSLKIFVLIGEVERRAQNTPQEDTPEVS